MYRFSRAIYRELAPEIVSPDRRARTGDDHARVLRACEAAVERLATDRHYFARPARTLFNDIRVYFPMSAQRRVWRVVEQYMRCAEEFLSRQPLHGIDVDSASTTLARNTANRDGDLGIEAVLGVRDGGGNRARGNGNPLQCRATTRKGTSCQRMPLPHNGYCPSHQHLAETEDATPAPGRELTPLAA